MINSVEYYNNGNDKTFQQVYLIDSQSNKSLEVEQLPRQFKKLKNKGNESMRV